MAKGTPVKVQISDEAISVSELTKTLKEMHIKAVYGIIQKEEYSDEQIMQILEHMQSSLSDISSQIRNV